MREIGARTWSIAEGYIPPAGIAGDRALESHETACLLNAGEAAAHVSITIYFADREPVGPYRVTVPARRRCICASTTSTIPLPFRAAPTTRA